MRAGVSPEPPGRKRLAGERQRPGYASRASRQHAEVALPRHRLRAERPQERTIPLRVDRHAARLGESGRQVGDRYSRGAGAVVEHRVPAERGAYGNSEGATRSEEHTSELQRTPLSRSARLGESGRQVGDRYSRGAGAVVEHRVPAERGAYGNSEGATDQIITFPYLDAVRPPHLMQVK